LTGLVAFLLFVACTEPSEPLRFEYAGCADTDRGCEIGGSPLRIWAPSPALVLELDGRPVDAVFEPVEGGTRATWASPAAGELVVRDGGRAGALRLVPAARWAWKPELDAARASGPDECRRVADEHLASAPVADRGAISWALAGCELAAGDPGAVGHMRDAAEGFDAAGRTFDAARARCATSSVLFGTAGASLAEIRGLLDAVPEAPSNAELAWGGAWHRALLHRRSGNYRAALEEVDEAERVAARLGLERERMTALELRATVYAEGGRFAEAIDAQRQLVDASPFAEGECERGAEAARRTTLAWFLVQQARSASSPPAPETIPLLEEVARFHRACGHPAREIANVEVNLALASWLAGEYGAAREHVDAARAAQPHPDALYAHELVALEARLAQAAGDPGSAERAWKQVVAMARLRGAPDAEAQALAGLAEVRRAMGRREDAAADLAAAHEALFGATAQVPLETGGAAFLSARAAMTEDYVSLLLELGREEEAFEVVRRARSHLVRSGHVRERVDALDEASQRRWDDAIGEYRALRAAMDSAAADGWSLPVDEVESRRAVVAGQEQAASDALDRALAILGEGGPSGAPAAVAPGDVLLAWFPVGGEWIGFAASAEGVRVARIGSLPDGD
jgi:tetratricopeptide (TPR) repeat protein